MPKQPNNSTLKSDQDSLMSPDYESLQKQQDEFNRRNPPSSVRAMMEWGIKQVLEKERKDTGKPESKGSVRGLAHPSRSPTRSGKQKGDRENPSG